MAVRLSGTTNPRLDEKGRLTLPAKFREHFADGLVVTLVQEGCLALYSEANFDAMVERNYERSTSEADLREIERWVNMDSSEEHPDRQGRFVVPASLRSWADLDRDIVMVGAGTRLELWSPERWTAYRAELETRLTQRRGS